MMDFGYSNSGWWNGGMILMGAFWLVLLGFVVWAVIRLAGHRGQSTRPLAESPRQILDRRFAAGEIDGEAYALARHVLEGRTVDAASR